MGGGSGSGGATGAGGATGGGGHAGAGGITGTGGGTFGSGGRPGTGGAGTGGTAGRGAGGNGAGGAGGFAGAGLLLMPDATGWIDLATNAYGIKGGWYGFSDGYGPNGTADGACESAGHPASTCSMFTVPSQSAGGFPNTGGHMCATGVAAQVLNNAAGLPDFSGMYGLAIGFDFNYDSSTPTKGSFDAQAAGVTGIAFDIDVIPTNGLRIQFINPGSDLGSGGPDYWGANASFPSSPVVRGTNRVYWGDVIGPYGLGFDPTHIVSMYFSVPTQTFSKDPFTFCISNVTLIKTADPAGRSCPNPAYPVDCPGTGGLAGTCWSANVNCNTITSCAGVNKACPGQAQASFFNCATNLCVPCSDPYPQGCPALGATIAQCWPAGIACSTIAACPGPSYFGCFDPSLQYDCNLGLCF